MLDFKTARVALIEVNKEFPNDADVNNLLGFTSRKLKMYSSSATYYAKALSINPKHLGALEYQGELFIVLKKAIGKVSNRTPGLLKPHFCCETLA